MTRAEAARRSAGSSRKRPGEAQRPADTPTEDGGGVTAALRQSPVAHRVLLAIAAAYAAALPWLDALVVMGRSLTLFLGALLLIAYVPMALDLRSQGLSFTWGRSGNSAYAFMLGLGTLAVLSLVWAFDIVGGVDKAVAFIGVLVTTRVLAICLAEGRLLPLAAYVISALIASLVVIRQDVTGEIDMRATYEGTNQNLSALVLTVGAIWALVFVLNSSSIKQRILGFGAFLLLGASALRTGSRTGVLALTVGGAIVLAVGMARSRGWARTKALAVSFVALAIGWMLWTLRPDFIPERVWGSLESVSAGDLNAREIYWESTWSASSEWLPWGMGYGSTYKYVESLIFEPRSLHNTFLTVVVELGLVGIILFCGWLVATSFAAMNSPYRDYVLAAGACMLLFGLTLSLDDSKLTWFVAALALTPTGVKRKPVGPRAARSHRERRSQPRFEPGQGQVPANGFTSRTM